MGKCVGDRNQAAFYTRTILWISKARAEHGYVRRRKMQKDVGNEDVRGTALVYVIAKKHTGHVWKEKPFAGRGSSSLRIQTFTHTI
jgi:hypothetical protein